MQRSRLDQLRIADSALLPSIIAAKFGASCACTPDAAGCADLLEFELEIARWLLREARFEVAYETFDAREGGPDYTVTFRVNTRFNVEARRIRTLEAGEERVRKLVETLVDKTRQMPPNAINLLVMSDGGAPGDDLDAAATLLRGLAERKVEDFFAHRGYRNAADFLRQYRQLSAVLFQGGPAHALAELAGEIPAPQRDRACPRTASGLNPLSILYIAPLMVKLHALSFVDVLAVKLTNGFT